MTAGRTLKTQSQHWGTPPKYVQAVKDFFQGQIDLDPCSNEYSIVNAKTEYKLPAQDGLLESWNYERIFVNPPYGIDRERGTSIKRWIARCLTAHIDYKSEVLALIPVATNTAHWKNSIFGKATAICFLYDTRLKFLVDGKDGGKGAPMSCAMVYWGCNYLEFEKIFSSFGAVIDIRLMQGKALGAPKKLKQHPLKIAS